MSPPRWARSRVNYIILYYIITLLYMYACAQVGADLDVAAAVGPEPGAAEGAVGEAVGRPDAEERACGRERESSEREYI